MAGAFVKTAGPGLDEELLRSVARAASRSPNPVSGTDGADLITLRKVSGGVTGNPS